MTKMSVQRWDVDCQNPAAWQVGIRVWALGHPKTSTPLEMFMGITVCDECKSNLDVKMFLMPEGVAMINNALQREGKAPIDSTTAELVLHDMIDGEAFMGPHGLG